MTAFKNRAESSTLYIKIANTIEHIAASFYEWAEAAVYSIICVILAFIFIFRVVGVEGPSMQPTLYEDERLILMTFMYKPQRGDIIVIDRYTDKPLVKRVIALGGDQIAILPDTLEVVLNGVVQDEKYAFGKTVLREFGQGTKTVPQGYVFVMGDNRGNSKDSRSAEVGFVNEKDIVGKAVFRYYPFKRMGFLH